MVNYLKRKGMDILVNAFVSLLVFMGTLFGYHQQVTKPLKAAQAKVKEAKDKLICELQKKAGKAVADAVESQLGDFRNQIESKIREVFRKEIAQLLKKLYKNGKEKSADAIKKWQESGDFEEKIKQETKSLFERYKEKIQEKRKSDEQKS